MKLELENAESALGVLTPTLSKAQKPYPGRPVARRFACEHTHLSRVLVFTLIFQAHWSCLEQSHVLSGFGVALAALCPCFPAHCHVLSLSLSFPCSELLSRFELLAQFTVASVFDSMHYAQVLWQWSHLGRLQTEHLFNSPMAVSGNTDAAKLPWRSSTFAASF